MTFAIMRNNKTHTYKTSVLNKNEECHHLVNYKIFTIDDNKRVIYTQAINLSSIAHITHRQIQKLIISFMPKLHDRNMYIFKAE